MVLEQTRREHSPWWRPDAPATASMKGTGAPKSCGASGRSTPTGRLFGAGSSVKHPPTTVANMSQPGRSSFRSSPQREVASSPRATTRVRQPPSDVGSSPWGAVRTLHGALGDGRDRVRPASFVAGQSPEGGSVAFQARTTHLLALGRERQRSLAPVRAVAHSVRALSVFWSRPRHSGRGSPTRATQRQGSRPRGQGSRRDPLLPGCPRSSTPHRKYSGRLTQVSETSITPERSARSCRIPATNAGARSGDSTTVR